ncbi:hypothetical protein [Rhizobium sp. S163]|uniref:hypothetical protein n=1 Tax=Rhizobium sp. S163 TaxID=3055039 RepID=UPI0025AA1260|nr:hypothetical protein [Rhizobium sp. S163]MDM9645101.1 hypothetical protein [Rhizobium sp. S163]
MTNVLFSLPVHEMPAIVRDQIENINYFCPGATIVIHISAGAAALEDEFRRQCDFPNVLINPSSYETRWNEGIFHTHVSNYLYALERGVAFDRIVLLSSNELLVKPGLAEYMSKFAMGSHVQIYDLAADWGGFRTDVASDRSVRKFVASLGLTSYFAGQAEGQFFNERIFARIVRVFVENFPMAPCGFNSEEVIPPTVAASLSMAGVNYAHPITFCDYSTAIRMTPELIDQIRAGKGAVYAQRVPRSMRSPHIGVSTFEGIFSVKRVPREDCELRRYVRGLMG